MILLTSIALQIIKQFAESMSIKQRDNQPTTATLKSAKRELNECRKTAANAAGRPLKSPGTGTVLGRVRERERERLSE